MEENETIADRLDRFANKLEDMNETLRWRGSRPLIRLNKEVVATLFVVADIAFKVIVMIKLWP